MPNATTDLSPRGAIVLGLIVIACGVAPILGALEIINYPLSRGVPVWVGIAAGGVFILGGLALINGYALGAGKNFDAEAPPLVRAIQNLLGFAISASFAAIAGWVAFGPGERNFAMSISLPFWESHGRGSELPGRALFGLGAVMCAAFAVFVLVRTIRDRR